MVTIVAYRPLVLIVVNTAVEGEELPIGVLSRLSSVNATFWIVPPEMVTLLVHNVEHQAFASQLNLENPFNMLDTDWNVESDFYDWLNLHYNIHLQIAKSLGL